MRRLGFTTKLLLAIAVTVAAALGVAFGAVHRGTESNLSSRLDDDLRAESDRISSQLRGATTPAAALSDAQAAVAGETFGRASQLLAVVVPGAGVATNQPEILGAAGSGEGEGEGGEDEGPEERGEASRILAAPEGYTDIDLDEAGEVRVLSTFIETSPGGPRVKLSVGQPTASIDTALTGLSRTFALVGGATLFAALIAGALLAARLTAPLRRMADDSEHVDADLSQRIGVPAADDEVRTLAESFNRALDRLQAVFEGRQRFVADASHELRTPLTVIRGQIEVLAREPDPRPEDIERVSAYVNAEVERMERMVEDMLALAKGEGAPGGARREVDVARVASEAFESMRVTADRDFQLSAPGAVAAEVEPEAVGQLVRILVRNALEHTADGGVVRLEVGKRDGSAVIEVEDDGPGIPPGERERVLERFHRAGGDTDRRGGAGLGLAIADAIVRSHSGSIEIGDARLGGARVTVMLPRRP